MLCPPIPGLVFFVVGNSKSCATAAMLTDTILGRTSTEPSNRRVGTPDKKVGTGLGDVVKQFTSRLKIRLTTAGCTSWLLPAPQFFHPDSDHPNEFTPWIFPMVEKRQEEFEGLDLQVLSRTRGVSEGMGAGLGFKIGEANGDDDRSKGLKAGS
jgi:hypothetical protein